jgi:iron complex transport system ATP-binding protein
MLQLRGLDVTLGETSILHDISGEVAAGEWIGLLGPNGSGKTTLLRSIGGAIPYNGSITLDEKEIREWDPRQLARRMAFVRQNARVSFDFTVEEVIRLGRSPYKRWLETYSSYDRSRVRTALEKVDLEGFENRLVTELSGGEQQLVLLAQALVQEADILLLDEPTNHLDVHHQYQFLQQVENLVERNRSVLTAFHDLNLAARYGHRLFILQDGRLVAQGTPREVLTEELIASVFRMNCSITADRDGLLNIQFITPL